MEKFLFTDGRNGVRQAESKEELENLIELTEEPEKIRVWIFHSSEWISFAAYRKLFPAVTGRQRLAEGDAKKERSVPATIQPAAFKPEARKMHWSKKMLYLTGLAATLFLVFNFTKIKWRSAGTMATTAVRPDNVPVMDIDSLITSIEEDRGQYLDRSTRTNLRLRNTWPERILLQATSEKETSNSGSRFFNVHLSIDNTTGFPIDQAVVRLLVWKKDKPAIADTFRFSDIRFDKISERETSQRYKGDSISVDFLSIRAKAFNFSYSVALKNEPGQYNDRWFSKD